MYDLHVPTSSYEREVGKLKQQVVQAEDSKDMVSRAARLVILDGRVGSDVRTRCPERVSDRCIYPMPPRSCGPHRSVEPRLLDGIGLPHTQMWFLDFHPTSL